MPTIGRLKYKIGANTEELNSAMVASKAQLREAARIMKETAGPAAALQGELDRLQKLYELGAISLEAYGIKSTKLRMETAEAKEAHSKYAAAVAEAKAVTDRHTTAEERHAASMARLNALKPHLSIAAYTAEVNRLNATLPSSVAQQQRFSAAQQRFSALMNEAKALTASVATEEEKRSSRIQRLNELVRRGAIDQETYNRALAKERPMQHSQGANSNYTGGGRLTGGDSNAGGYAVAALTGGISFGVREMGKNLSAAGEIEQTSVALEVLTGSAAKATNMLLQMKQLDANSALNFPSISAAGKTLAGYGLATEKVMPALRSLGDISLGNDERFKSLALAYGQVAAAGRLTGQEVLQMVNNGFNPLQIMAEKMAKEMGGLASDYMPRLRSEMADGKISFEMFAAAVEDATTEGGRFAGLNEAMAQTTDGAYGKMQSEISQWRLLFGDEFKDSATAWYTTIGNSLRMLRENAETTRATMRGHVAEEQEELKSGKQLWEEQYAAINKASQARMAAAEAARKADESRRAPAVKNLMDELDRLAEEKKRLEMSETEFAKMKLRSTIRLGDQTETDRGNIEYGLKQIDVIENMKKAKKAEEERLALVKKAEDEAAEKKKRDHAEMVKKAETLRDKLDPSSGIRKQLDEINALKEGGFINASDAIRAREQAVSESVEKDAKNKMAKPETVTRGSVEEYKLRVAAEQGKDQKQFNLMERQRILQEQSLAELKRINGGKGATLVAAR